MNYKNDDKLIWYPNGSECLLKTRVFDVLSINETAPDGSRGDYVAVEAPDWVLVIPEISDGTGDDFVLVRQWRHALGALTTEFPGGVADSGETYEETAARELEEETGFRAGKITLLGVCNPNPALFCNRVAFCLAENLDKPGAQKLDDDEYVTCFRMNRDDVISGFGSGEFVHALMGTALAMYMRHRFSGFLSK